MRDGSDVGEGYREITDSFFENVTETEMKNDKQPEWGKCSTQKKRLV